MFFKDEKTFLDLAKKHGKLQDCEGKESSQLLVAIFAEQCKIIESSYVNAPARSLAFA